MSPFAVAVYLVIAAVVVTTFFIGRSLDKQQSNDQQTWKTRVVGWKTIQQSIILGLIGGPLIWLLKGGTEALWLCIVCMMAAPFIVDMLRPQVTLHDNMPAPARAQVATRINGLNLAGVIMGVALLGFLIVFSAGLIALPKPGEVSCKTCDK
jgi:hypothetical protein